MKKCPICHAEYPRNYTFCPIDGATVVESDAPAAGQPFPGSGAGVPFTADPVAERRRNRSIIALVVAAVVIFVAIPFLLIVAMVAIPSFGSMRKHANEFSAIQTMRTISQAEMQYENMYPANGFACPLSVLAGDPENGSPASAGGQLLPENLSTGIKNGYVFAIVDCENAPGSNRVTSYKITAIPQKAGKTGNRGFCSDKTGVIEADPAGGTNCTQPVE